MLIFWLVSSQIVEIYAGKSSVFHIIFIFFIYYCYKYVCEISQRAFNSSLFITMLKLIYRKPA